MAPASIAYLFTTVACVFACCFGIHRSAVIARAGSLVAASEARSPGVLEAALFAWAASGVVPMGVYGPVRVIALVDVCVAFGIVFILMIQDISAVIDCTGSRLGRVSDYGIGEDEIRVLAVADGPYRVSGAPVAFVVQRGDHFDACAAIAGNVVRDFVAMVVVLSAAGALVFLCRGR